MVDFDPFEDSKAAVHVRKQQRNGRKSITTVQGLPDTMDLHAILKALRKELCCNGCIIDSGEFGAVMQLQGDHRSSVCKFLVAHRLADAGHVYVHGD